MPKDQARRTRDRSLPRSAELPLVIGDVVERDMDTRWLRSAAFFAVDGSTALAVFFSEPQESERIPAVVAFAPPERSIGWLDAAEIDIGVSPASRLQFGHAVLDLQRSLSATVTLAGGATLLEFGGDGARVTVAIHRGAAGELALSVFSQAGAVAFFGASLSPNDYQVLGTVPQ